MLNRVLGLLSLYFLIFSGFPPIGICNLSIAQDCRTQKFLNNKEITNYSAEPTLEYEMLALTNQHRLLKGLPSLVMDIELTQIARRHSQDMACQGFISHSLPSGNLKSRMVQAGYQHEIARENVATAPSVIQAQNALIESPGHESNMLAEDITRIGIGIARCPEPFGRQLYITEIFASPRKAYQAETVEKVLETRVDELRQNGAGEMSPDPLLEQLASRSLRSITMPYKREQLQQLLTTSAAELPYVANLDLSRLQASVQLLHNPKNLSLPNHAQDGQARSYGASVRQVTDGRNQPAFLVLTLIGLTR
ncbi:MAG: CAP domain-containing protein [Acidobacteria bacterium]|nr:CAP domain-containing protein [Acidobacteriota bacterium]